MPELPTAYQNEPAFAPALWDSQWYNTGSASNLTFTVYCDQNYDIGVRWSVDNTFSVIEEESVSILATVSRTYTSPVKARYVQVFVKNIAVQPSVLMTQAFFFLR